ncbi:hypothetical protein BDZ89DRAFT_1075148 [Hymenopellis radicata]|nr:hypothetical protein BDZ89DRAFT_1075148 [Hymenopellis radicata]
MTTIVAHPPMLPLSPAPIVPQRRRRDSIEVIDVDEWPDELPPPRPTQRRRMSPQIEVIDLMDSDVEEMPASSGRYSPRTAIRRRYFSPPPPNQDDEVQIIPPIPPLPHRRMGRQSSIPMRRHAPLHPAANPVLPSAEPFEFEAHLTRPIAGPSSSRAPTAPRRSTPNMRLGGALITDTQAARAERRQEREARRQQEVRAGFRPSRRRPVPNRQGGTHFLALNFDYGGLFDDSDDGTMDFHYKQEYTHPKPADPGFTFDFAPTPSAPSAPSSFPSTSQSNPIIIDDDDDDTLDATQAVSSSSSTPRSLTATLVCAHCGDHLMTGVPGGEEEERKHRIWSLRCGHIIDGKCADKLSVPPVPPEAEEILGSASSVTNMPVDQKGKGKGKAVEQDAIPLENPIRSRLRSHQPGSSVLSSSLEKMSAFLLKRKGKAKVKPDETYQWACPVEGCRRMHTSVKTDGKWGPDKTKGEGIIGVFV